jgi:hypothetical protein
MDSEMQTCHRSKQCWKRNTESWLSFDLQKKRKVELIYIGIMDECTYTVPINEIPYT